MLVCLFVCFFLFLFWILEKIYALLNNFFFIFKTMYWLNLKNNIMQTNLSRSLGSEIWSTLWVIVKIILKHLMWKRSGITICNNNWIRVFLVFRFIYLLIFFSIFVVGFCVLVVVDFFSLYKFKEFFNDAHIKSNVKEIF